MRSAVELAVPVWSGSLTQKDINLIERVQKTSVKLILGASYQNYNQSLEKLNLDTLASRREKMCLKFAKKCTKSQKFKHWFTKKTSLHTRSKGTPKEKFFKPFGQTKRYLTSSIPYLIDLLNKN